MDFKDRIKKFVDYKKISVLAFQNACGLSNAYVASVKAPKEDKINAMLNAFPEINRIWLITGEGEMLNDSSTNVGDMSGNDNIYGMNVNQSIGENNGQNAGRDIVNICLSTYKQILEELKEKRMLYAATIEKKDEQIRIAQSQIETLIKQNQEQFNRFMSLLEAGKK